MYLKFYSTIHLQNEQYQYRFSTFILIELFLGIVSGQFYVLTLVPSIVIDIFRSAETQGIFKGRSLFCINKCFKLRE